MPTHPIATVTIPQNGDDVKLDIIRENVKGGDWHNRFVQNQQTKVLSYKFRNLRVGNPLLLCERTRLRAQRHQTNLPSR